MKLVCVSALLLVLFLDSSYGASLGLGDLADIDILEAPTSSSSTSNSVGANVDVKGIVPNLLDETLNREETTPASATTSKSSDTGSSIINVGVLGGSTTSSSTADQSRLNMDAAKASSTSSSASESSHLKVEADKASSTSSSTADQSRINMDAAKASSTSSSTADQSRINMDAAKASSSSSVASSSAASSSSASASGSTASQSSASEVSDEPATSSDDNQTEMAEASTQAEPAFICPFVDTFYFPYDEGLYPDAANCSMFYQCANGLAYHMACPFPLVFDPILKVCNYQLAVDLSQCVFAL